MNDSGVIERAVEPAEAFDGSGDELLDVGLDRHVRPYEKNVGAGPSHEIERRACRLFVDVADHHVGTAAREADCDGSPDASCGSCDKNRFAAEIEEITGYGLHFWLPFGYEGLMRVQRGWS